jgi:serine/threonine-protein kinase HipA
MAGSTGTITIWVYAHWQGLQEPMLMGVLAATRSRGKEIFSFEYDSEWLKANHRIQLDPDLQLFSGRQYLSDEKPNFGIFLDSSPDRWGRVLMKRREAILARNEKRKQNTLFESDYLLGVFDENRMGALRFKTSPDGKFMNHEKQMATPPFASLRDLEFASLQLEEEPASDKALQWLNILMAPGSSLGGARPKASVIDTNGQLWIAKFPSKNDDRDIGAWEMVARDLAVQSGINMAPAMIKKLNSKYHTFINQRFDRTVKNERVHFASAMTLLGYNDGTSYTTGVSYLGLAEFIMRNGTNVKANLTELWRRIVFNISIKNTDDHLRNHGFLLTARGWTLSPAFDINPIPDGIGLTLNISEDDNSLDTSLALGVAEYFRLDNKEAKQILKKVQQVVSKWREAATKYKISKTEQNVMEGAFEYPNNLF